MPLVSELGGGKVGTRQCTLKVPYSYLEHRAK